jgi:hypothetical protein
MAWQYAAKAIDLPVSIDSPQQPIPISAGGVATKYDHVAVLWGPLAPDANEASAEVEDHVVASTFEHGLVDIDARV